MQQRPGENWAMVVRLLLGFLCQHLVPWGIAGSLGPQWQSKPELRELIEQIESFPSPQECFLLWQPDRKSVV